MHIVCSTKGDTKYVTEPSIGALMASKNNEVTRPLPQNPSISSVPLPNPPPKARLRHINAPRYHRQRDRFKELTASHANDGARAPPSTLDPSKEQEDVASETEKKPSERRGWCLICFDSGGLQRCIVASFPWPKEEDESASSAMMRNAAVEAEDLDVQAMRAIRDAVYRQYGTWKQWLWCYDVSIAEEVNVSFVMSLSFPTDVAEGSSQNLHD